MFHQVTVVIQSSKSSNVNEVVRAVLNSLFHLFIYFFLRKDFTRTKQHKNAHKRTKIKKAECLCAYKTSKGKKVFYSLICVFVLFMLLCFCLVESLCFLCFFLACVFVLFVLFVLLIGCVFVLLQVKYFRKKMKRFKTALITLFTLLLDLSYYKHKLF